MKKFFALVWLGVITMPCLLTLTESVNGTVTIWNLVGIVWTALLFVFWRKITPKGVSKVLKEMVED